MNTRARAEALATCAESFGSLLGKVRAADLLELVRLELGHAGILDGFQPYGGHLCKAIAPKSILHIVSGNTPHAALQSVIRGLLLGSKNNVKIPADGLPDFSRFVDLLPAELAGLVTVSRQREAFPVREADAVVVYGSDATIAAVRKEVPASVPFQAHGHRVSACVVFDDPEYASVDAAARDASLHDQQGCLSPHDIYVDESSGTSARSYAARFAEAMEAFNTKQPRRELTVSESAAIADLRAGYTFRASSDVRTQIWSSMGSTAWTVIYEEDPWFATSPLNRVVFVKPLPSDLSAAFAPIHAWLGGVGIFPATQEFAERLSDLGASRICPLGRMQFPPFTWHAEGASNLASLVSWLDFEPDPG